MNAHSQTKNEDMREEIGIRAYHLWEAAGQPNGRDAEFWLKAEVEILAASRKKTEAKKSSPGSARSAPAAAAPVQTPLDLPAGAIPTRRAGRLAAPRP